MKAVVKTSKNPGAEFINVDTPAIKPNEVLIKVKAAAICGSDIHIFRSSPNIMHMISPPVIFGHELAGETVAIGEAVTNIATGDRVAVETHLPCGHCYFCQTDAPHNCQNLAIFGCGPIGLFAIGTSIALGARKIFALEISPKRLAMARQLFPDATIINPTEQDPVKTIMQSTNNLGVDVAIELSGSVEATKVVFQVLRRGGRISFIGTTSAPVEINIHRDIILKEIRVYGSFGRLIWQTWWQVQNLIAMNKFDPLSIVTHRFNMADYAEAIELAASGEAGKILLYP